MVLRRSWVTSPVKYSSAVEGVSLNMDHTQTSKLCTPFIPKSRIALVIELEIFSLWAWKSLKTRDRGCAVWYFCALLCTLYCQPQVRLYYRVILHFDISIFRYSLMCTVVTWWYMSFGIYYLFFPFRQLYASAMTEALVQYEQMTKEHRRLTWVCSVLFWISCFWCRLQLQLCRDDIHCHVLILSGVSCARALVYVCVLLYFPSVLFVFSRGVLDIARNFLRNLWNWV